MRILLCPRGRILVGAQGDTKFAKCHSGFVYVVRPLVTLRLLGQHMQHIEETIFFSVDIYYFVQRGHIYYRGHFIFPPARGYLLLPCNYIICSGW